MVSRLISRIARCLDDARIDYMLIGGQAVLAYGEPRLTRDVDVTIGLGPDRMDEVLALVSQADLEVLVEDPVDFARRTCVVPCRDRATQFRVDLILSWSPYEQAAFGRTRSIKVEGVPVRFASPEDLIIHKIIAGRARDLEDVVGVIRRNPGLDDSYVRHWLQEFDKALEGGFVAHFESLLYS